MPSTAVDYYRLLGVGPDATSDEIAQAFRARAKRLHPDTSDDPDAPEQFKELAAAYAVLSDHRRRREYDRAHPADVDAGALLAARRNAPAPTRWTRRRAWYAFVGGLVVTVLGVVTAFVTWHLHDADAARRAAFVAVTAKRVDNGEITFVTHDGQRIVTREPTQHGEGSGTGPTVGVRYDPANPRHVIVDANTLGRDITFAIVALKFLIGGIVFVVLGYRKLRATDVR